MGRKMTVYNYWTWVPGEGLGQIAPTKRPRAEIDALGGLAIFVTAEEVDEDSWTRENTFTTAACPEIEPGDASRA
jgi:hypothetical protein